MKYLIQGLVLLVLPKIIPGIHVSSLGTAILAVLFFALLNATIGMLLKIFSFPLNLITLGLFNFVINALILKLTSVFFTGFKITFGAALIAAVILAIVAALLEMRKRKW
mgnify:FL=1